MLRNLCRHSLGRSCAIVLLFQLSALAFAQTEFSADIVNHEKTGPAAQARIFAAKDKMRFESAQKDNKMGGGAFIMNFVTHTSLVVMPQQHMYMEMPQQAMEQRGLYSFFESGDVENACSEWLKVPHNQGGTCHKVGHETVNGRDTVKYAGTDSKGEAGTVWIDPKLGFPVKWDGKNGGGEMQNIQEGPQPASLFEVPAGYTKMDMGAMMQQRMSK